MREDLLVYPIADDARNKSLPGGVCTEVDEESTMENLKKRRISKRRFQSQINITPLIDVLSGSACDFHGYHSRDIERPGRGDSEQGPDIRPDADEPTGLSDFDRGKRRRGYTQSPKSEFNGRARVTPSGHLQHQE
jgi:hypothetical protein